MHYAGGIRSASHAVFSGEELAGTSRD